MPSTCVAATIGSRSAVGRVNGMKGARISPRPNASDTVRNREWVVLNRAALLIQR